MKNLYRISCVLFLFFHTSSFAQADLTGRDRFESDCARCHGGDAMGGEAGPAILQRVRVLSDTELVDVIRQGKAASGMPAFTFTDIEMTQIVTHLQDLLVQMAPLLDIVEHRTVILVDGQIISGEVLNTGLFELQLRSEAGEIYLLRALDDGRWRRVTSQYDWTGYHGQSSANRYASLTNINKENIARLAPAWNFPMPGLIVETTPVVDNGIMYVSSANQVIALDAGSGRQLWHYQQSLTAGITGLSALGINRGVAVAGDRVFLQTDHTHIQAISRHDGTLLWDTEMADYKINYEGTAAPLVVDDMVIVGVGGGDSGVRGFLAAYDSETGIEVWRRWTIPAPGEPGSETWEPQTSLEHGGGATWMTGSYDADLGLIYWPVGNPGPDFNGDGRLGDNLYTDSILALDSETGEVRWYYQFTPHDVHDWDAQEPPVLVETEWQGEQRQLLIQANRNGFFYVFDRTDGELLLAKSFLNKLNWASGIDEKGRPVLLDMPVNTNGESYVCPGFIGGTNWYSTSYSPQTGLYYFQATEGCDLFSKGTMDWEAGSTYMGGSAKSAPGEATMHSLRALDIQTGETVFDIAHASTPDSISGGVLSTAANIVFYGDRGGEFVAADAIDGEILWSYSTNQSWKSSPMTYLFDGEQYIVTAVGPSIMAFKVVGQGRSEQASASQ